HVAGARPRCERKELRLSRRLRAQALVEFAFAAPILLVMLLAMIDFGRAYYAGVVAEQAAREGARLGMGSSDNEQIPATACSTNPAPTPPCTPIEAQVRQALGLCTGCYNSVFLSPSNVTINVGGRDASGSTFGRYQGAGATATNATC